jgi:phospholipid/cholesterol/gamma-HCH transport system substrate-binding protein
MLRGIAAVNDEGERVFGRGQPGLHITAEVVDALPPYAPGQEPLYGDDPGPTCYGLDGDPIRPFPFYRNPVDGYRDGEPVDPWTGLPPGEKGAAFPASGASFDRAVVGAAVAPALGLTPGEVPDVALLLYGPVA